VVVTVTMVIVMMMIMMQTTRNYFTLSFNEDIHIACNRRTIPYKIQQIEPVITNTSYFVMLLLHVSPPTGHFQGCYFTVFRTLLP